ncbi:MAG: hypothetical protein ACTIA6_13500 [Pseudoclavibacter sp.]
MVGVERRIHGGTLRQLSAQDLPEQVALAGLELERQAVEARRDRGDLSHPLAHGRELGAEHPLPSLEEVGVVDAHEPFVVHVLMMAQGCM